MRELLLVRYGEIFLKGLNRPFFMRALVLLFGRTEYLQNLIAGRSVMAFVVASVGINAVVEMIVAAVLTGAISAALHKAHLIEA